MDPDPLDVSLPVVPEGPSLRGSAIRGAIAGVCATALAAETSLLAAVAAKGLPRWLGGMLGYDLAQILGFMVPTVALVGSAHLLGKWVGWRARRRAPEHGDARQASAAGAGMGATAATLVLVALFAAGSYRWLGALLMGLIPAMLGLGVFGRSAFRSLEPTRSRIRLGPAPAPAGSPQLYSGMAAAGIGWVVWLTLFLGFARGVQALGLSSYLRLFLQDTSDWTWAATLARYGVTGVALIGPAVATGRLVRRLLPDANRMTLALAAAGCFLLPAGMVVLETWYRWTSAGMEIFGVMGALATIAGSGAYGALAAARAPAGELPGPGRLALEA